MPQPQLFPHFRNTQTGRRNANAGNYSDKAATLSRYTLCPHCGNWQARKDYEPANCCA